MIVVDASALLEALLGTAASAAVTRRIFEAGQTLHAPHLLDVEVVQVLRRYAIAGDLDDQRARAALDDLADFPIRRYPHGLLFPRAWELRNNFSVYDAVYVALAEVLGVSLLTADDKLANAHGARCRVEVLR